MLTKPVFLAHVDAFTPKPFAGNPAGVCILPAARPEAWMQAVAREMNLSETAFLLEENDGWRLRWFTPAVEVDLCGHATLASAHILWEVGLLEPESPASFFTRSGELTAWKRGEWIELDFPADPEQPFTPEADLVHALGGHPAHWADGKFDHLAEFGSEAEVRALAPDMAGLARLKGRGVIATARAAPGGEFDFVSRFFGPAVGIPEDPVTGSAHCMLAPYWGRRLGKTSMVGYQCSARGGTVRVRLSGERVILGGQAVTVAVGEAGPEIETV
jgi:PhzF family phenazine biosynthesis protein